MEISEIKQSFLHEGVPCTGTPCCIVLRGCRLPDFWVLTSSLAKPPWILQDQTGRRPRSQQHLGWQLDKFTSRRNKKMGNFPWQEDSTVKHVRPSSYVNQWKTGGDWAALLKQDEYFTDRPTECVTTFRKLLQMPARYVGRISRRAQDIHLN